MHKFIAACDALIQANLSVYHNFCQVEDSFLVARRLGSTIYLFENNTTIRGLKLKLKFSERKYRRLEKIVGGFRHPDDPDIMKSADLAYNFQRYYISVVVEIARSASKLGLSSNLAHAGGCAHNSSTNGQLLSNTDFEHLHIPSAPGDDGNCLGTALYEKHYVRKDRRIQGIESPYLGSPIDYVALERIINTSGVKYEAFADKTDLRKKVADLLSAGCIIGWMQGRAEFGPRALGNRSILADPRSKDMKDKVNGMVKYREAFRPLAPTILHKHGPEIFENYQEIPYMERTLRFRDDVQDKVPGVVHVDGTGRLQTVKVSILGVSRLCTTLKMH